MRGRRAGDGVRAAPRWLRTYLLGDRLIEGTIARIRGAWDGVWLGLLDEAQLAALDEHYYDGEDIYRSEAHNRLGLFDWEDHAVSTHFPPGCQVLVTGAGGGREVLALLGRGFDVVGYEPHRELAAAGSAFTVADGYGERVHPCARSGWPGGSAEAVVLGWGSYMLMPSRAQRIALLRAASAATGSTGPVLLSYFPMPAGRRQFWTAARVAAPLRRLLRREPVLLGDSLTPNFAHHFTGAQVEEEVRAAGLTVLERGTGSYGWAVARASRTQEERT